MLNVKILGALLARKVENYKDPSNRELTVLTGAYAGAPMVTVVNKKGAKLKKKFIP